MLEEKTNAYTLANLQMDKIHSAAQESFGGKDI